MFEIETEDIEVWFDKSMFFREQGQSKPTMEDKEKNFNMKESTSVKTNETKQAF